MQVNLLHSERMLNIIITKLISNTTMYSPQNYFERNEEEKINSNSIFQIYLNPDFLYKQLFFTENCMLET